jgi:site-specific DNA recombinase
MRSPVLILRSRNSCPHCPQASWENPAAGPLPKSMSPALHPDRMTPAERLDELAEILAAGLMTPVATRKGSRLYRYYTSMDLIRNRATVEAAGPLRLPAGMVEGAVIGEMRRVIRTPEVAVRAIDALRQDGVVVDEPSALNALTGFDAMWTALFPAEQARIARLLVQRVTVSARGIAVDLRHDGVGAVIRDMMSARDEEAPA